ncbi:hypothetical protein TNCV_533881 [Trichonephila clavipes]|nr:hypothetical protein TNCV_533881 [Trichonephila clavipes]
MIVQFRNEKVSNQGSIPITIDCNVVAFIVFEEGFHHPIKRTKQSKKIDLIQLARDLDESPDPSMSKIVLRDLIISSKYYKEEEAKELLEGITAERLETEQQQKL